jgi:hypothetical protein
VHSTVRPGRINIGSTSLASASRLFQRNTARKIQFTARTFRIFRFSRFARKGISVPTPLPRLRVRNTRTQTSLLEAANYVATLEHRQRLKVAFLKKWLCEQPATGCSSRTCRNEIQKRVSACPRQSVALIHVENGQESGAVGAAINRKIFTTRALQLLRSHVMNLAIRPGPWGMGFTLPDRHSRTVSTIFSGPLCLIHSSNSL